MLMHIEHFTQNPQKHYGSLDILIHECKMANGKTQSLRVHLHRAIRWVMRFYNGRLHKDLPLHVFAGNFKGNSGRFISM